MNLVVGGGVIGLPFAASNFGYIGFCVAIFTVVTVAMTTQYFNLSGHRSLIKRETWEIWKKKSEKSSKKIRKK